MSAFAALVGRDLNLAFRQGGDWANVAAFFALAVILFPFGVGPEPELLARIAIRRVVGGGAAGRAVVARTPVPIAIARTAAWRRWR